MFKEPKKNLSEYLKLYETVISEPEQLKFLIENFDGIISMHDFDGRYLYYYASETFSILPENIIGKLPSDIFEKKTSDQIIERIKKTAKTGEKSKFEIQLTGFGEKKWFEGIFFPVKRNGKITYVISLYKDINDKKEAISEIKKQKEFFRKIINSITHPLYVINAETYEIEFVNNFALNKDLPKGLTCHVYSHGSENPCSDGNYSCPVTLLKYNNKPVVTEHVHTDSDGNKRFYEVHGFPVNDENGKLKQVIEYNIDITEKKLAEVELQKAKKKAEESERLKSAFLANMSHEIRTPLNGMLGFAELLKKKNISEEKKLNYLNIINKSGEHLLELINDIIDISKLDSGLMKYNESETNLNMLVNEVFEMLNRKFTEKNKVKFRLRNQYKGSENIFTDSLRLKQILINLTSNALKFTTAGFVEINWFLTDEKEIKFCIEDTGIGIEKQHLPFVFERFRQVGNNTPEIFGGTGLGLSITKACIKLLGGKISVKSEISKGSIFSFTIPYKI